MSFAPIEFFVLAPPVPNTGSVAVDVSAATRLLTPVNNIASLGTVSISPTNLGTVGNISHVTEIVSDPRVSRAHVSGSTLYVSFASGLQISGTATPSYQPFSTHVAAYPVGTPLATVLGDVRASTTPAGSASTGPILSTTAQTFTASGLAPGTAYEVYVVVYDSANDYIDYAVSTVTTRVDVSFSNLSVDAGITVARASVGALDPDSSNLVRIAIVDPTSNASSYASAMMVAGSTSEPFFETLLSPASSHVPLAGDFSNLAPGREYKAVAGALDFATSNVTFAESARFFTHAEWTVDEILVTSVGFSNVTARVDIAGTHGVAFVDVATIPDTPSDELAWISSGADPLGNVQRFSLSNASSLVYTAGGLSDDSNYKIAAKASSSNEPWLVHDDFEPFRTVDTPSATVSITSPSLVGGNQYFFGARAAVAVSANYPVNVYTAVVPISVPDATAFSNLLMFGSAAYPDSFVDQNQPPPFTGSADRGGLAPGTAYKAVAVATFPFDLSYRTGASLAIGTVPLPTLTLTKNFVTDTAIEVDVDSSAGTVFNTYLHITSNLIANQPVYDASLIANGQAPNTQLFLGQSNYDITTSFSNLLEDTQYGVVAVASDNSNVLVVREFVAKTGSNPNVGIQVLATAPDSVDYRVIANDSDSSFDLYTVIGTSMFSQTDADRLASDGLAFAGGVAGTATEFPNDLLLTAVNIPYTACNLLPDTNYVVMAVAQDDNTRVVRFQQIPFTTDFDPTISFSRVSPRTERVDFDVAVQDRDGPSVTVSWKVYPSPMGLTADLVASDPGVSTVVDVGAGARTIANLSYAGLAPASAYYLAAVVSTGAGNKTLEVHSFRTFARPTVSVSPTVYSENVLVDMVAGDPDVEPFNGYLAIFGSNVTVDSNLAAGVVSATGSYVDRVAFLNTMGVATTHDFASLAQGTGYVVVGVAEDILSGDLVFASAGVTTRVRPSLSVATTSVKRESFAASLQAFFTDPVPSRSNEFDYAATVVPRGAPVAWLVPGAVHATDSNIPIVSASNAPSFSFAYDALGSLSEFTAYDFVLRGTDFLDNSNVFVHTVPFATRSQISVSFTQDLVSPSNAVYDFTAAVLDGGTMEVRAQAFPNPVVSSPDASHLALAASAGTLVSAGTTFGSGKTSFDFLVANLPYLAVFVATDEASGESNFAFDTFTTTSVPPAVDIDLATVILTSASITATVRARDADSPFKVYSAPLAIGTTLDATALSNVVDNASNVKAFSSPSAGFAPFSVTFTGLGAQTPYRFVSVAEDALGNRVFDFHDFTTLSVANFLDAAEYDGAYTLAWRSDAVYSKPVTGATLANGKFAFVSNPPSATGAEAFEAASVKIGGSFDFDEFGGYTSAITDGFNAFTTRFFAHSLDPAQPTYTMCNQELNMATGVLTSAGSVVDHASGSVVALETDVYALRNSAFSAMKTLRITPSGSTSTSTSVPWFHEIAGADSMVDPVFNSVVVNSSFLGGPLSIFEARSGVRGSGGAVACSAVYLFEAPITVSHDGFNRFRNSTRGFNRFTLSGLAAGTTYRVHVLVTQATSADFSDPGEAVRRLAVSLRGSGSPASVASSLRSSHAISMAKAWEGAITVEPRVQATATEQLEMVRLQRAIRFAQFTIMGSVRDGSLTDLNPATASTVDTDGSLLWGSELYVIPYLLYTNNRTVRKLLETSYRNLEKAKALADGSGLQGALYPFVNPNLDYASQPFWDVASSQYVFKTALVGIAAWDYFRVTLDRSWLIQKGYAILAGVADMVVSKATIDSAGVASMASVLDATGAEVDDDAFTLYTSRVALKGAIEASYELGYLVPAEWKRTFFGISVPQFTGANFEIIRANASAAITDRMDVLHPLLVLQEHFSSDYLRGLGLSTNNENTLTANALFYASAATAATTLSPQNLLLIAGVYGVLARSTGASADTFDAYTKSFLAESAGDIWGSLADKKSTSPSLNNPALCAQFLTNVVANLCGLGVAGGTTESGFRYEHYGVFGRFSTNLPNAMNKITVPNVGRGKQTFTVTNERLYVP